MTIEPGTILDLTEDQYEHGNGPLRLRVTRVLHHLSQYYDHKKLWVEGERLTSGGEPLDKIEVLLVVGALTHTSSVAEPTESLSNDTSFDRHRSPDRPFGSTA